MVRIEGDYHGSGNKYEVEVVITVPDQTIKAGRPPTPTSLAATDIVERKTRWPVAPGK